MRILFVAEYYPPVVLGGAEISLRTMARELAKRHAVSVLTPNYHGTARAERKDGRVSVIEYPSIRRFFFARRGVSRAMQRTSMPAFRAGLSLIEKIFAREMARAIEREASGFDVVHSNNRESLMALDMANISAKKIAHIRDARPLPRTKNVSRFMTVSDFLKSKFSSAGRVVRVYNPVDVRSFTLSEKGDFILFVGSLTKDKGTAFLPDIAARTGKTLVALGDGPEKEALKKRGIAVETGDVRSFYARAPFLLVPSQWEEGFGRVVVEGQASGCVVIATRKGALPELIKNGKTGFLVDDAEEMASIITKLKKTERKRISAASVKASKAFSPEKIAALMEKAYGELA